ncbi:hypothetical protein GCM10027162_08330 [Streptomyces incanus]
MDGAHASGTETVGDPVGAYTGGITGTSRLNPAAGIDNDAQRVSIQEVFARERPHLRVNSGRTGRCRVAFLSHHEEDCHKGPLVVL